MNRFRWDAALDRLPQGKKIRVAEVGVWCGTMSEKLLEGNPYLRLIQIDRWKEYSIEEREHEDHTRFSMRKQEYFDKARVENLERTKKFRKRIRLIEKSSMVAAPHIKNKSLDMVFIDALHSFLGCRLDILRYLSKIKQGGWIGGHDFHRIGVCRAVYILFGNNIETDVDRTWWVRI